MKIRLRLTLLLGCLLLVFGSFAWLIQVSHDGEARAMLTSLQREREILLDRLLDLTSQSLQSFSTDYARWDDMVHFVQAPDPAWAEVNLQQSLVNFGAQAAWVLRTDGSLVYHTHAPEVATPITLPPGLVAQLARETTQDLRHFFWISPAGLLEMRAAPILPSDYLTHPSPTLGWWVAARIWDDTHLQRLAQPMQSTIHVGGLMPPPSQPTNIHLQRQLCDWSGQPIRVLYADYQPEALLDLLDSNGTESLLFYGFSLTLLLLTVVGLSRWVVGPLGRLEEGLATGQRAPLTPLLARQHEFGHLARLIEQSFTQRDALKREIGEREKAEADLRQSKELHSRLARDLHDGAIQSIYAAGLGLENMRPLLHTNPLAAEQRLDACLRSFNQTIASIRNFISGLESDSAQPHTLGQSMTALVETMRSLQPIPITLSIDAALSGPVPDKREIHLLQIVRESLSNALRHSGATAIGITLQAGPGRQTASLVIADDGCGFDPSEKIGTGHGLTNLAARAHELQGRLQIDSAPGKGTRLTFTYSHSATPAHAHP